MNCEKYNTTLGIYKENCGLDNVLFAYGHDEYMFQMLKANNCSIPDEGLAMIRYHSAYCWHTGGAYREFMTEKDETNLKWVLEFNKFDLYTKSDSIPDVESIWPHYQGLIEKYGLSGKLKW